VAEIGQEGGRFDTICDESPWVRPSINVDFSFITLCDSTVPYTTRYTDTIGNCDKQQKYASDDKTQGVGVYV